MKPELEPKQFDSAFNLYSIASLESTLQSGREPQKRFWQQLSPSVLVFKLGEHLFLAMDRVGGRSKGCRVSFGVMKMF